MPIDKSKMNGKAKGGLLGRVKAAIEKSGQAKKGIFFVQKDKKARIRFLQGFDDGMEILWHRLWDEKKKTYEVDTPCLSFYGKECAFCGNSEVKTQMRYCWRIYAWDQGEQQLFIYAANNFTPVPAVIAAEETLGTITEGDFMISRSGEGVKVQYGATPMPPKAFRVKVKLWSDAKIKQLIWDAFGTGKLDDYPDEGEAVGEDEDDEEETEDEELDEEEEEEEIDEEDDDDDEEEEEQEPPARRKKVAAKAKRR